MVEVVGYLVVLAFHLLEQKDFVQQNSRAHVERQDKGVVGDGFPEISSWKMVLKVLEHLPNIAVFSEEKEGVRLQNSLHLF